MLSKVEMPTLLEDGGERNKEAEGLGHVGMDISCEVRNTIRLCSMEGPENSLFTKAISNVLVKGAAGLLRNSVVALICWLGLAIREVITELGSLMSTGSWNLKVIEARWQQLTARNQDLAGTIMTDNTLSQKRSQWGLAV